MRPPPASCSPAELHELLRPLAARLIWWQPAKQSLSHSDRVIAQVLELGTFEAGQSLRQTLGDGRWVQVLQRAERKDNLDVAALLGYGLPLAEGLGAARALDGAQFPMRECLKALVYFADGDLAELGLSERHQLEQAVMAVDAIPSVERISSELGHHRA